MNEEKLTIERLKYLLNVIRGMAFNIANYSFLDGEQQWNLSKEQIIKYNSPILNDIMKLSQGIINHIEDNKNKLDDQ